MVTAEATMLWVKKTKKKKIQKTALIPVITQNASFYKWLYRLTGLWSNCAIIKLQKLPLKIAHSGSLDRTKHPHAKTPGKIAATFWKSLSSLCNTPQLGRQKVNAIDRFVQHSKCGRKSPNESLEFPFSNLSRLNHTSGFTGKSLTVCSLLLWVFHCCS